MIFQKWGGGGLKAVWNFSKNSSDLVYSPFPQDNTKELLVGVLHSVFWYNRGWQVSKYYVYFWCGLDDIDEASAKMKSAHLRFG